MSKTPDLESSGPTPPAEDPFPIVVPPEEGSPSTGRAPGWLRDFVKSSPQRREANTGQGQPTQAPPPAPRRVTDPVQRATIQMLPGRLEPVEPIVLQQEIRFLKGPGKEQVVTLGWNLGEPPHHVTLNHSSVQPVHARMTYRVGNWWIESLAPHDPVEINNISLAVSSPPMILVHGDLIRLGDVRFRFSFP